MGRRVRGAVRAFPLGCARETLRLRVLGLPAGVSAAVNVVACTRYTVLIRKTPHAAAPHQTTQAHLLDVRRILSRW